jgi:uncharacterized protein (TIGR00369 family)
MQRIKDSFNQQGFMKTLGAKIINIEPGKVVIACAKTEALTQQHGFIHAGVLTSLADTACGYAALSAAPEEADVLSVEFKINLMRPAKAERIIAVGEVLKAGRTLVFCEATVTDETGAEIYAKMLATIFVKS